MALIAKDGVQAIKLRMHRQDKHCVAMQAPRRARSFYYDDDAGLNERSVCPPSV